MKYGVPLQKQIYTNGMAGKQPLIPIEYKELRIKAQRKLSDHSFAYIDGGAGQGKTILNNESAFDQYYLKASMMQSSSEVDLSVQLFGKTYRSPLLAAPIGVLELAHSQADLAVAKACQSLQIPMIFSNQASFNMEVCSAAMNTSPRWFQLYWSKSDELVHSFVSRAEACGCEAIIVTLDTTSLGWRPKDLDLGYLPFLRGLGLAQYSSDPIFQKIVADNQYNEILDQGNRPNINLQTLVNLFQLCKKYPGSFFTNLSKGRALAAVRTFINIYMRPELRWSDIQRLRQMTSLPIIVKGIQNLEDAYLADQAGADGIIVSNHGGRQIDGGVSALSCLDSIGQYYSGSMPILFDSGIRSGADIIKALALGADAVLIGRPYVYGLALEGENGVRAVFQHLLAELELQLSLMGISAISQLDRSIV